MGNKQQPAIDPRILSKVVEAAGAAAQAAVNSPQYMEAMARLLIRESATNPGGFSRRPVSLLTTTDFLVPPTPLADGTVVILTMFPIDVPTSYTLMVLPDAEQQADHHHEIPVATMTKGPTEVAGPTDIDQPAFDPHMTKWQNYSVICYKDQPGVATDNHIVTMHEDENDEVLRQLNTLGVAGVKWYYLTKLVLKDG